MKIRRALLLPILAASLIRSQPASQPSFEVASIKPGGDLFATRPPLSPGRLNWTTQLVYLIGYAYSLDFSRVSGDRLDAVYTINAVFDAKTSDSDVRLMLKSLLRERFNLRAHPVAKQVDGYGLAVGKNGGKMKESDPTSDSFVAATMPSTGVVLLTGKAATISQLIETLSRSLGTPLWDHTGLTGKYDFTFRFAKDLSVDVPLNVPSLSTALRDNLGMVIEKQRGPLETLVVDHVELPSAN